MLNYFLPLSTRENKLMRLNRKMVEPYYEMKITHMESIPEDIFDHGRMNRLCLDIHPVPNLLNLNLILPGVHNGRQQIHLKRILLPVTNRQHIHHQLKTPTLQSIKINLHYHKK